MISCSSFLTKKISDFIIEGFNFSHLAEMNIITIANKMDMSYEFHIRHNMHAVQWKLIAMINRNKGLINKLNRIW